MGISGSNANATGIKVHIMMNDLGFFHGLGGDTLMECHGDTQNTPIKKAW